MSHARSGEVKSSFRPRNLHRSCTDQMDRCCFSAFPFQVIRHDIHLHLHQHNHIPFHATAALWPRFSNFPTRRRSCYGYWGQRRDAGASCGRPWLRGRLSLLGPRLLMKPPECLRSHPMQFATPPVIPQLYHRRPNCRRQAPSHGHVRRS